MNVKIFLAGLLALLVIGLTNCSKQEPIAGFSVDYSVIQQGQSINFTDQSLHSPTSWEWTFNGGDPASSTSQNPTVTYTDAGKYSVSLVVSNSDGSDMVQKENMITVNLPPPVAAFSADRTSITTGDSVNFSDQSTNDPTAWIWIFEGGSPGSSSLQNPSVTYYNAGSYNVYLHVTNLSGDDELEKVGFISVSSGSSGTDIIFHNTTHTPIDIDVDGDARTIPSGGSVSYSGLSGSSVDFYASTSGETAQGSQIGMELVWDNTITLGGGLIEQTLLIEGDYYFLYMQNEGTHRLSPIDVGIMDVISGFTASYTEYIVVPNDNVEYPLGYYETYSNTDFSWMQVQAYYEDSPFEYTYWQVTVPDTNNQSVTLINPFKKSSVDRAGGSLRQNNGLHRAGDRSTWLLPDYAIKPEDR
jgi:PKD repeat protein